MEQFTAVFLRLASVDADAASLPALLEMARLAAQPSNRTTTPLPPVR
jgi:hypothetical protein